MKRSMILVLLLIIAVLLSAEDFAIRKAWKLDFYGTVVSTADNCEIVLWEDTDAGDTDIYAQKLSSSGEEIWVAPKIIANGAGVQSILSCVRTIDHNFVIFYQTSGYEMVNSYHLQKFNSNGQLLWGEHGVEVMINETYVRSHQLVPNELGGVFLVYVSSYPNNVVSSFNLDGYGNNLFPVQGKLMLSKSEYIRRLCALSDHEGGFILHIDLNTQVSGEYRSELHRFSEQGLVVGAAPMIPANSFPADRYWFLQDKKGRYVLANVLENSLNLQRMDNSGNLEFDTPVSHSVYAGMGSYPEHQIVPVADGGLVYCSSFINAGANYQLESRIIRLDDSLEHLWNPDGVIALIAVNYQHIINPRLSVTEVGGVWFSWVFSDYSWQNSNIQTQYLDANGNPKWDTSGKTLCSGAQNYNSVVLIANPDGNLFIFKEYKDGYVKMQREYLDTNGLSHWAGGSSFISRIYGFAEWANVRAMNGNYFVWWSDYRWGGIDTHYQIYNANMQPLLEPGGRCIFKEPEAMYQIVNALLLPDGSMALAVLKMETSGRYYSLYLQKVLASGELIFPDAGILVSGEDYSIGGYVQMYHDANEIYMAWKSDSIKGQKISGESLIWGEEPKVLAEGDVYHYKPNPPYFRDGYLVYTVRDSDTDLFESFIKKFTPDGEPDPAWPQAGIKVFGCENPSENSDVSATFAGQIGGDLVIFGLHEQDRSVWAQKISPQGVKEWGDSGILLPISYIENVRETNDGIYLAHRMLDDYNAFGFQKIDASGQLVFDEAPLIGSDQNLYVNHIEILEYENGAIRLLWDSLPRPGHWYRDIYMLKIGRDGVPLGEREVFCSQWLEQTHPVAAIQGNSALVVWNDARHGIWDSEYYVNSIYGRILDAFPVSNEDEYLTAPQMTRLMQNYPNPFNPHTTISFDLAMAEQVELSIYNIKGQLVKTLVRDQKLPAGRHNFVWDGKDENGRIVSSGIYLYRLQSGRYSHSKKMIMLK